MKKIISLSLALLMILSMCACNKIEPKENTTENRADESLAYEPVENPERLYITSCNIQHFSGFGDLEYETDQYIRFYEENDNKIMEAKIYNPRADEHVIAVFSYDDYGKINAVNYQYYDFDLNLTNEGTYTVIYEGNNITQLSCSDGGTYNYEYNKNNQITSINDDNSYETFEYDGDGRIIKYTNSYYGYSQFSYGENGLISSINDVSQNYSEISSEKSEFTYNDNMQLQSIIKKFDDGSVYYSRAAQYDEFGRIKNVTNNFPAADGSEGDTYTCDYTYENGNMSFYTAHDKCTTLCTTDDEHNLKKYESKSEYSNITTTFGYDKLTEEQVKMYEIFNTYFLYFFTPLGSFEKMEASLGNNMLSGLDYYLQVTNYPYIVTKAIYNNI